MVASERPTVLTPRLGSARLPLALAAAGLIVSVGSTAAAFRSPADSPGNSVTAAPDFRAPAVTASALGKSQGGATGFVKKAGAYFIYANVNDSGNPASGTASVTANVTSLTGASAVVLSPGSFVAGGQSYNHRSAQQTAGSGLTEGAVSYSIATADNASNSATTVWPATIDNTAPFGADVQATNTSGGTAGKAEQGDTLALTYSEPIEPESILAGWNGSATNVVVRVTTGIALLGGLLGQDDGLQVFDAANTTALPLGAIDLKQPYVAKTALLLSGTMTFGASGASSTMSISGGAVTIVLGTRAGNNALTVATPGTMAWGPSATPYDRAANATSGVTANESGGADVEF
jgi:hypothetical protein